MKSEEFATAMMNEHYTLRQLNLMVRDAIEMHLPDEYWVEAELSECRENSGHCYMELIEKDERSNTPVARASAKCWRQTWLMVKPYFERTTGQPLRVGMKVLLKVYAQFHEAYGFSWIVSDIDPTYTLGDMARKRQEIIRQLKEEGVFDLQRELRIPTFAKRIAVISAQNAAGYGDFCRQLEENEYGFRFDVTLFPAIMQGEQVEQSVIAALNKIYELQSNHTSQFSPLSSQLNSDDTEGEEFIAQVTKLVADNLSDTAFNIDRLCREMAMSRTLFYIRLKTYTGKSPQDFIRIIRLERAAALLRSGRSVADTATLAGFDNPKYFSTVFKKYFGVSPSKY